MFNPNSDKIWIHKTVNQVLDAPADYVTVLTIGKNQVIKNLVWSMKQTNDENATKNVVKGIVFPNIFMSGSGDNEASNTTYYYYCYSYISSPFYCNRSINIISFLYDSSVELSDFIIRAFVNAPHGTNQKLYVNISYDELQQEV